MNSILISSSEAYSGKSAICMGIGSILKEKGYKVGYMKPIGNLLRDVNGIIMDEDVKNVMYTLELKDSLKLVSPLLLTEDIICDTLKGKKLDLDKIIKEAFINLKKNKELILVEGTADIGSGAMYNLSDVDIAKILGINILLISKYHAPYHIDKILYDMKIIGDQNLLSGVILNKVPLNKIQKVKHLVIPFLEKKGIKILGFIPQDRTLKSVSVQEIIQGLNGKILGEIPKKEIMIEQFLIGAMEANTAIRHFKRATNYALITGGDRSDIQVAALESNVKCLILTGNLYPSPVVLGNAEEKGVPVILVHYDTMTTIEKMEQLLGRSRILNKAKLNIIKNLIKENIDLNYLFGV